MSKVSDMASTLGSRYPEQQRSSSPQKGMKASVEHRGRPKGSRTRKEEVQRAGFECEAGLLAEFFEVAGKRGKTKREAFEEALKNYIKTGV